MPGPHYLYLFYILSLKNVSLLKRCFELTCADLPTDNTPGELNYGLSTGQVGGEQAPRKTVLGKSRLPARQTWGTSLKRGSVQEQGFLFTPKVWRDFLCKSQTELFCNCSELSKYF